MNKNYINIIRKSLNSPKEDKLKNHQKIIFPSCDYKSESVFEDKDSKKGKNGNLRTKKLIVKKTKRRKNREDNSRSDDEKYDQNVKVISDSNTEVFLTPSRSENTSTKQKMGIIYSESEDSYDEDTGSEFELDEFSNSRDHINNESVIETYSEIEDEFCSSYIKRIKISTNPLIEDDLYEQEEEELHDKNNSKFTSDYKEIKHDIAEQKKSNILEENKKLHSSNSVPENIINEVEFEEETVIAEDHKSSISYEDSNGNNTDCEISSKPQASSAKYFHFENFIAVILKKQKSIHFIGNFIIKVLKGKVQILGSILDKSSKETEIYSPRGYSLLAVKNISDCEDEVNLRELYHFPSFKVKILNTVVNKNSAVFLCFKMQNERLDFIEKYMSQQIFPKIQNESLPKVIFEPKDNMNLFIEEENWELLADIVNSSTRLFIAGGKGVGKSTFLRYLINKLLNQFEEIRVVDLDPGQAEFCIPGCISVVNLSQPCIGPNFTHLSKPERSYLCDISIADPARYIKTVKCLSDYISTLHRIPTLINYMGYSKGLGIKIASSVITLIGPTNIIQIDSRNKNKNFPFDLNLANIRKNCDYFGGKPAGLNYRIHKLMSVAEESTGWKLEPRQARELCVLAYLGALMAENRNSLTDHNLPMYEIKLSSIKLRNLQNNALSPAAVNASLVALCNLDETYETFVCLGYGVIRGIDLENDYLVLITQVKPEILDDISYLVLNSITLPPSVYMTPQNIRGLMPYVMEGELTSLAQLTKRSYLPAGHTSLK